MAVQRVRHRRRVDAPRWHERGRREGGDRAEDECRGRRTQKPLPPEGSARRAAVARPPLGRGKPCVRRAGAQAPAKEVGGIGKGKQICGRRTLFRRFRAFHPGRRTRFETATDGDSASSRWRLASPHVAIHPRVSGDWYRHTWRFTQGCLAIGIATGGDSPKGVWRLVSPQMAIHPRVSGDWYRHRWRFTQGCLAIPSATDGDCGNGWWRS